MIFTSKWSKECSNFQRTYLKLSEDHRSDSRGHAGKNTKEALNAGFVWGYEGLINNIINKIISRENNKYKIILTGGYANFFNGIIKKRYLLIKILLSKE